MSRGIEQGEATRVQLIEPSPTEPTTLEDFMLETPEHKLKRAKGLKGQEVAYGYIIDGQIRGPEIRGILRSVTEEIRQSDLGLMLGNFCIEVDNPDRSKPDRHIGTFHGKDILISTADFDRVMASTNG